MDSLYLLIPVSLVILCFVVWVFIWAVNNRQFDDLEKHGYDIIFDNDDRFYPSKGSKAEKTQKAEPAEKIEQVISSKTSEPFLNE